MCRCESWTIKKAECWRIDTFEPWCWRRLLRVPWTARRSNQSILKEISPEYPLEGLMMKLKLQYFGHLMRRMDSLERTLMLGTIEGRQRGQQIKRWLDVITSSMTWVWASSGSWWWTGRLGVLQFVGLQSQTRRSDCTELKERLPLWSSRQGSMLPLQGHGLDPWFGSKSPHTARHYQKRKKIKSIRKVIWYSLIPGLDRSPGSLQDAFKAGGKE